ncbi:cell division protein FtsA [Candidatus Saccharibacteria bacterium RIFCSPHIGHO2_01_FULL_45_15]|nr:MAG: cell division protein FtsA [Candidatus Saccharibacteria bacterium RIFCSPHIGHO2_01_FULL_45_15]OGL27680.1 MAG: cell division protein FtsA [Candidatus Saccharibacteria bacterium RIFCSPHIGHO2_02_FULL_46_12]OGL32060.1 MAG: cell division protein FtsA [Candidatus Saccharibacteria bacterium RIFCSPHIGHO2_12_FULL_44_22]
MQDSSRYAVGIDIGTTTVRCVVGHIDATTGTPTIVGIGSVSNTGMRKGAIANLTGPARAIDDALGEAERMSGYQVDVATLTINGSHILSSKADGMIAVGAADHEITDDDIARLEEVATVGKVPANREILEVVPHSYRLDGQDNIKDPIGMTGTRLEIRANVVSALAPHVTNLQRTAELAKVIPRAIVPSVVAAARAVLTEQQLENGVAVIDLGGATTSIAVFEEGDLQFVSVLSVGGANITNDLAIGLKTDPEIAELVKLQHGSAVVRGNNDTVGVKVNKDIHEFAVSDIDDVVDARLEEIFEAIQKELKRAGYAGKLPSGVVLVGGSANLKKITDYAKESLGLAVRLGSAKGYGGVGEHLDEPQFAAAVGLMLADSEAAPTTKQSRGSGKSAHAGKAVKRAGGFLSGIIGRFKA